MKSADSKDRVMLWMRQAVNLNLDKLKMFTQSPVASEGFVLNYIDLLLQLAKPFIGNFNKYGTFISKVNCFYLINNQYISKATDMEKISQDASETVNTYLAGADVPLDLSGNTTDPFTEESSLMGGGGRTIGAPNFITDCFFLVHILISFLTKKAE